MKKLFNLVLIFTMCFTSAVFAVDTADATVNAENEYLQAILNEIKVQGGYTEEEMATAEIVSGNNAPQARTYGTASPLIEDAALKIETVENNMIKQDIIVPQTLTEDGQFINLLASSTRLPEVQEHIPVNISNSTIIIYNSFYYGRQMSYIDYLNYYQAFGQSCRWTSSNPTATVSNIKLTFRMIGVECTWIKQDGELYCYPTDQGVVEYKGILNKYQPVKDQVYTDWSIMFPDNFCMRFDSSPLVDKQAASGHLEYTCTINGSSMTDGANWLFSGI